MLLMNDHDFAVSVSFRSAAAVATRQFDVNSR